MPDYAHMESLQIRLTNERERLANAKTQKEHDIRQVWVNQIEKEIADEFGHSTDMTDDELLAELNK